MPNLVENTHTADAGARPCILVAEDRGLIAAKIERLLRAGGCAVAGPVATCGAALGLLKSVARIDAAVLDVDLRGEPVYPVADALAQRGIPFLFLTGYGLPAISPPWRTMPLIEKPFESARLLAAVGRLLSGQAGPAAEPEVGRMTPTILRSWEVVRQSRNIVAEAAAWQEMSWPRW